MVRTSDWIWVPILDQRVILNQLLGILGVEEEMDQTSLRVRSGKTEWDGPVTLFYRLNMYVRELRTNPSQVYVNKDETKRLHGLTNRDKRTDK